jgi:hypothetical protein
MGERQAVWLATFLLFAVKVQCAGTAPLRLVDSYKFPSDVKAISTTSSQMFLGIGCSVPHGSTNRL